MRTLQRDSLMNFLKGFIASNGYGPTIKEIGDYFGWSSSASVHDKLHELENLGLIRRSRRWRGIEIVNG